MKDNRFCVIMCGGVGSRFWPYSRKAMPKQFIDFLGTGRSLLQLTVDRLEGIVPTQNIIILTNEQYSSIVQEQLPLIKPEQILLEPTMRNTAPCNAWAAWHIKALNPNAKIMVAPSDHFIIKLNDFKDSIVKAFEFLEKNDDAILTLGVKPNRPETGYGYIQEGTIVDGDIATVKTFTEKPDKEVANLFLESGEFFWNSGMFFWGVDTIINAMREHAPEIADIFDHANLFYGTPQEQEFINEQYAACPNISIDYAVMEKSKNVYVQKVDFGWSDLGTWGSIFDNSPKNKDGNVTPNTRVLAFESNNNVIAAQSDKLVVVSGLNGYIVADTPNALLIVPKNDEQKIKNYVNEAKTHFGDKYL